MRLLLAARLSRSSDSSTSIEKQDDQARRYADALDHEIVGTAADTDVSGKTDPFARPELGPWLTDPELVSSYDGIIAASLDRFARSTKYMSRLLEWADEHGKVIICVSPSVDFSTPVGRLIAFIMSWLAQEELALITKRSADTRKLLHDGDYLVGRPMYGYRVAVKDSHKTLEPDPAEADVIREAAESYLAGQTLQTISDALKAAGKLPRPSRWKGKAIQAQWVAATLSNVLRNPMCIGRRCETIKTTEGRRVEYGRCVLKVEPILTRDTWQAVNDRLDERAARKGISASGSPALLTSLLFCASCLKPMYRVRSRGVSYYYCRRGCKSMVREAEADRLAEMYLLQRFGSNERTVTTVEPGHGYEDEIADAEADLRELDWRDPEYDAKSRRLREQLADLAARPKTAPRVRTVGTGETVERYWQRQGAAGRREMLKGILYAYYRKGWDAVQFTSGDYRTPQEAIAALTTG